MFVHLLNTILYPSKLVIIDAISIAKCWHPFPKNYAHQNNRFTVTCRLCIWLCIIGRGKTWTSDYRHPSSNMAQIFRRKIDRIFQIKFFILYTLVASSIFLWFRKGDIGITKEMPQLLRWYFPTPWSFQEGLEAEQTSWLDTSTKILFMQWKKRQKNFLANLSYQFKFYCKNKRHLAKLQIVLVKHY